MARAALSAAGHAVPETRHLLQRVELDVPVSVWIVDGSIVPPAHEVAWLNPVEVARASRFRNSEHRSRYVATHVALRHVVAQTCRLAQDAQCYECDSLGRWRLTVGAAELSFSYAGTRAMIALGASVRLGIDIERIRCVADADQLAETCFSPAEQRDYTTISLPERNRAFLRGWTRKEAALKALGVGLQRAPNSLHTGLDGQRSICVQRQRIELMSFETSGLVGAIARLAGA